MLCCSVSGHSDSIETRGNIKCRLHNKSLCGIYSLDSYGTKRRVRNGYVELGVLVSALPSAIRVVSSINPWDQAHSLLHPINDTYRLQSCNLYPIDRQLLMARIGLTFLALFTTLFAVYYELSLKAILSANGVWRKIESVGNTNCIKIQALQACESAS